MNDWRLLGAIHRRRDEAAASIAQEQIDRHDAGRAASVIRWPGIVAAIRRLVAAYNRGLGRDRLVVVEATDQRQHGVTIESIGERIATLVVTLDETEIRVDARPPDAHPGAITRWVDLARSDDDTAAYVLQEWMERL